MNCPSRPDDTSDHPGWNQNPPLLNADVTTCQDLNGIVNTREHRDHRIDQEDTGEGILLQSNNDNEPVEAPTGTIPAKDTAQQKHDSGLVSNPQLNGVPDPSTPSPRRHDVFVRAREVVFKYAQFVGPGFLISVAYIDPGNYQTDINAGAATKFSLLFIVLMSNLFAIFLQTLCIKLGSVTGLNLAENCRAHLPRWLNITLYLLAETAIIATDMAEVIGSAIALNLLLHIPLVAGCAITLVDVLVILMLYNPDGSMGRLRLFEFFVMGLVFGVVICFCIQLSYVENTTAGDVFKGYLPSSAIVNSNGIYLSCGILGATVMPHSIFLGSGIVQSRLRQFDFDNGTITHDPADEAEEKYRPSISAIRSCLSYSMFELASSLFTFALFVNSAILIVAGSSLHSSDHEDNAATSGDLFSIYHLLSHSLAPAAGTIFALALLLSGTSAGIVCTMAGQMVSEGMINWTIAPWLRRLLTRGISIIPSIIVAAAVGKEGLNTALTITQVILSVILPFVTAPLIYFTAREKFMWVSGALDGRGAIGLRQGSTGEMDMVGRGEEGRTEGDRQEDVCMKNSWYITILACAIWGIIVIMNVALLVLVGLGKE